MEPGTLRKNISCILNDTEKYKVNFKLAMTTEVPQVAISPSDFVYFKVFTLCVLRLVFTE